MRLTTNQHEVEIEVDSMDKNGTTLGQMWIGRGGNRKNIAIELLEQGLGSTLAGTVERLGCVYCSL